MRKQPPESPSAAERRADGASRAEKPAKSPVTDRRTLGWEKAPREARYDDANVESMAIDPEELRDFLSADGQDVGADPVFKERLRETLWKLVEDRYGSGDDDTTER
jgi:hypothetical protein